MGEELYAEVIHEDKFARPCRVYAPVGSHEDLLPYLVRRLLENGANTSFVNRIIDESVDVDDIVEDPIAATREHEGRPHSSHTRAGGAVRRRARELGRHQPRRRQRGGRTARGRWTSPRCPGPCRLVRSCPANPCRAAKLPSSNPANVTDVVGTCRQSTLPEHVEAALSAAESSQPAWDTTPVVRAGGDSRQGRGPVRTAPCRVAGPVHRRSGQNLARRDRRTARGRGLPALLRGPGQGITSESRWSCPDRPASATCSACAGRGTFVCISPWNFPLAIFAGQVSAALAAGNAVLAKPAEQTPLVAYRAVQLLHEAGVPTDVLHFLPGDGATIGGTRRRRSAGQRRGVHGLDRNCADHQPGPGRTRRPDCDTDRRDRRAECDVRGQFGTARAGRQGRGLFRIQQCRAAVFGTAHPVRSGGHRRSCRRVARRLYGRARGRRSGDTQYRCGPGDRRGGSSHARGACRDDVG